MDGGAGGNDFLVQMMSDIVDQVIERSPHSNMSCLGAAFLAGLAKGKATDLFVYICLLFCLFVKYQG